MRVCESMHACVVCVCANGETEIERRLTVLLLVVP